MHTYYLHSTDLDTLRSGLIASGVLVPADEHSPIRPAKGIVYVEIPFIEATPAVMAGLTVVTPATLQPGVFANVYSETELAFMTDGSIEVLPEPDKPVSTLFQVETPATIPPEIVKVQTTPSASTLVSRRSFFLALYEITGLKPDYLRAEIPNRLSQTEADVALIEFEAPYFEPTNPMFDRLAFAFDVTADQLKAVWALARTK